MGRHHDPRRGDRRNDDFGGFGPEHGPGGPGGAPDRPRFAHGPGGPRGRGGDPRPDFGPGFGGFGFGPVFGPRGRGGRGGQRVRRGDVRGAILDVLGGSDDELNGYQVIQAIADRTEQAWKPSPGSVYPTVQQLEDEGLLRTEETEGRKILRLTEPGRAYVAEHAQELAHIWAGFEGRDDDHGDLPRALKQTMAAVGQVLTNGTDEQRAQAKDVMDETRKKLYGILAEG